MQTKRYGFEPRGRLFGALIAGWCLGLIVWAAPPLAAVSMDLTDGHQALQDLPLGRDLYVSATGLVPSSDVVVTLVDWQGRNILDQPRTTDSLGALDAKRLWFRTGIGGCECRRWGRGYPFRYPHEAEIMLGFGVTVKIFDAATHQLLVSETLEVVNGGLLIFTANVFGCPLQYALSDDTLLLRSNGPSGTATVFLVPHQESWVEGDPLVDAREGFSEGQVFGASAEGWNAVLWQGAETYEGEFDVVIRQGKPAGGPVQQGFYLEPGDTFLDFIDPFGEDRSNGGLVIDDWGCNVH